MKRITKKYWWMVFTFVFAATLATGLPAAAQKRSGFGLRFDIGLAASSMEDTAASHAHWSSGALVEVDEYWDFYFDGDSGISPGVALFYRFNPHLTMEVEARGMFAEPDIISDYEVYWTWNDGRSLWNSYRGFQYEDAELSSFVTSLNMLVHLNNRGSAQPFVTFGLSSFDTRVEGLNDTAYAYTYSDGTLQYLDFDYPLVDFDSDARTMGFNVGAGGDFFFNRNMALTTMVKYYHSQKEQTRINPGGEYYELSNMSFEIDPSFWLVTCGVKFIF